MASIHSHMTIGNPVSNLFIVTSTSFHSHNETIISHVGKYLEKLPTAITKQLQAERAASGLTYKKLADLTGTHEQTLMKYFKGQRDIPMSELIKISEALEIAPADLVRRAVERMD